MRHLLRWPLRAVGTESWIRARQWPLELEYDSKLASLCCPTVIDDSKDIWRLTVYHDARYNQVNGAASACMVSFQSQVAKLVCYKADCSSWKQREWMLDIKSENGSHPLLEKSYWYQRNHLLLSHGREPKTLVSDAHVKEETGVCFLCRCRAIRHGDSSIGEECKGSDELLHREHRKCLEKSMHGLQRCSTSHIQLIFSKMCKLKYLQFILPFKVSDMQTMWAEVPAPIYTHCRNKSHCCSKFRRSRQSFLFVESRDAQTESQKYIGLYLVPLIVTNYKTLQLT